jgi:SAM-dependent methyltransferase
MPMTGQSNPYDELPYRSVPIEWSAPERLALASLLHGGPRPPLGDYRVLELGCGDGANLLPLAYYRRHGSFVGVDGARSRIEVARARKSELGLSNVEFLHGDFLTASRRLSGKFDYILAHGVFSWVPEAVRDALLELCAQRLGPDGLLYLNYNARPGWNLRGMVRDFLLAQTAGSAGLATRAERAREVSAKIASILMADEHPYAQLMAREFRAVCERHPSYVAHEYLAPDNHAYWRGAFLALARRHDLDYLADADFNTDSGRVPEALAQRLDAERIAGRGLDETVDLLCYRQMHCPILTRGPWTRRPPSHDVFASLLMASCLAPSAAGGSLFRHPSGHQVEAEEEAARNALTRLQPLWPRGLAVGELFKDVSRARDDLRHLQRSGLIELRCVEPGDFGVPRAPLNDLERHWGDTITTPYHTTETTKPQPPAGP